MSSAGGNALLWLIGTLALLVVALVVGVLWMTAVPGRSHAGPLPPLTPEQFELSSQGARAACTTMGENVSGGAG